MNNSLDIKFQEMIAEWDKSPRRFMTKEFRERYKPVRSLYKHKPQMIGPKVKMDMLRATGKEIIVI